MSNYVALVCVAASLVRDIPTAEEVVQDSFVAMHRRWQWLRSSEKALAYLCQDVENRSRATVNKNLQKAPPDMLSAEDGALDLLKRSAVISALSGLPRQRRQAIDPAEPVDLLGAGRRAGQWHRTAGARLALAAAARAGTRDNRSDGPGSHGRLPDRRRRKPERP